MKTLHDLLVDGTRYAPVYRPSLNSDHMPMTLCAITGLGGGFDACVQYREEYKSILHEISQEAPLANWRQGIGRTELYPSLFTRFREEVARKGIESMVGEYLPEFIGSLAMDAFHPIIRLGYAIDFRSEAEIAAALAYIVSTHREVPVKETPIDVERALRQQTAAGSRSFRHSGFTRNIHELIDAGDYPVGCAAQLGDCAAVALDIYRGTRNFFALHMVTATQAVRICSELIDARHALAALTGGLLATHCVTGSPGFERDNALPAPDRLDAEHTYKYVWACLSEHRYYGDERYAEDIRRFRAGELVPAWCAGNEV